MACPLCESKKYTNKKIRLSEQKRTVPAMKCAKCGLLYVSDLHESRDHVYGKNYSVWGADEKKIVKLVEESKKANFKLLLSKINKHMDFKGKSILDVGTGNGYLLEVAKQMGFKNCYGLELSPDAAKIASRKFSGKIFNTPIGKLNAGRQFDLIVMADLVEHLPSIGEDFEVISRHVKKGGLIAITTPNTDSITRIAAGKNWYQYKFEHVVYFNKQSMKYMLKGYKILRLSNNTKTLNLAYYKSYIKKYVSPYVAKLIPDFLGRIKITNPILGELLVIARKK